MRRVLLALLIVVIVGGVLPAQVRADIESYAIVKDDASLLIRGKTIRLFGIYIPPSAKHCGTTLRPARCASRASLALDFLIQGFVRCTEKGKYRDGSISALCRVRHTAFSDGQDLGAYLIREGWALALPNAPFEYLALQRIARAHHKGVWGFQVDSIRRR